MDIHAEAASAIYVAEVSDRPSWILISSTPATKSTDVFFIPHGLGSLRPIGVLEAHWGA